MFSGTVSLSLPLIDMLSESIVAPPSPSRALVAVLATDVVRAKPFSPFLVSHAGRCSSFEGRSFSVSAGPSVASHWSRCPFPGRLQVMPAPCRRCSSFGFCLIHEVARPRISKGLVSDGGSSGVGPHAVSCFMPEGPALSTSGYLAIVPNVPCALATKAQRRSPGNND